MPKTIIIATTKTMLTENANTKVWMNNFKKI